MTNLPEIDTPTIVFQDLLAVIVDAIKRTPRTLQTAIGPSEIGVPCTWALIHKVAGHPEPERAAPALKPVIGTAFHSWAEGAFRRAPINQGRTPDGEPAPRFLLERRVTVGLIDGVPISGSCDLFDIDSGTVVDWKTKGKSTLLEHRRHGPGDQYRVQAHLYGRGMQALGYAVHHVMIVFVPRDGELSEVFHWAEPYNENIAIQALSRATELARAVRTYGADMVLALYPPCTDRWCPWCHIPQKFSARPVPPQPLGAAIAAAIT